MKQMQEAMAEGQKKTDEAVLAALSDEQKKALETLKGSKFEFPESLRNPFSMMRMGGFGGGFGGFGGVVLAVAVPAAAISPMRSRKGSR